MKTRIAVQMSRELVRLAADPNRRYTVNATLKFDPRLRLRDATRADLRALAQLHVRTFNETHGRGPDYATREHQWRSTFQSQGSLWFCVVLETEAGDLVGFAKGLPYSDAKLSEFGGELNKIYLLREYHRTGLGRRLLCAAAQRFLERGITSMLLFGDAKSPTNRFYEVMGGERLYAASGDFHGGYGWRNLGELVALCAGRTQADSLTGTDLTV